MRNVLNDDRGFSTTVLMVGIKDTCDNDIELFTPQECAIGAPKLWRLASIFFIAPFSS